MLSYAVAACSMYDWDTFNRLVRLCVQLDVTFLVSVVHDHAVGTAYNGVGMWIHEAWYVSLSCSFEDWG
jgi:hypothetical protein